jgi:hypothetical protein
MDRERFTWDCVLIEEGADTHRSVDRQFSAYWSPRYFEGRTDEVAAACAAEAFMESKRKGRQKAYRPVSAQLAVA